MFAYYDPDADIAWFPTGESDDIVSERASDGLRDFDRTSRGLVAIEGLPKVKGVIETSGGVAMILEAVDGIPLGEIGGFRPKKACGSRSRCSKR